MKSAVRLFRYKLPQAYSRSERISQQTHFSLSSASKRIFLNSVKSSAGVFFRETKTSKPFPKFTLLWISRIQRFILFLLTALFTNFLLILRRRVPCAPAASVTKHLKSRFSEDFLRGEFLPAFLPSRIQNVLPGMSHHSFFETVLFRASLLMRLVSPFHSSDSRKKTF